MTAHFCGFWGTTHRFFAHSSPALCCQQCSITFRVGGLIEVVVAIGDRDWVEDPFGFWGETKLEVKWRCRLEINKGIYIICMVNMKI